MSSEKFATRLGRLIPAGMSERAFAREIGISIGGLRGLLHEGNSPTLETLVAIAKARGITVSWLATGEGPKFAGNDVQTAAQPTFEAELLGRVVDRIARVYREEGVRLPDVELGRLAAEKYAEIIDLTDDPDEWSGFLEVVATRVRKALRTAAVDPATVKREA